MLFNNTKIKGNYIIWCLTHSDQLHPQLNSIIGTFLYSLETQEYSYLNYSHPDIEPVSNKSYFLDKIFSNSDSFIFGKKDILHYKSTLNYDIDSLYYLKTNSKIPYYDLKTQAHLFFERKYQTIKINNIIPITKHLEYFKKLVEFILPFIEKDESLDFYSNTIIPVLHQIEKNPIKIDKRKFDKFFELEYEKNNIKNNLLYSYYNPFSTTGRFICSYNGLNLQTLNKENNSKEAFLPTNDYFLEIDYDGYHVRLIGELIGYNFGNENVHQYLAKKYFGDNPTEHQLKESKELTFKQLYGGVFSKYKDIEFFKHTQYFINKIWKQAKTYGFIETPLSKRKIHLTDKIDSSQKLFNYLIQAYESEKNAWMLSNLFLYLEIYKTKVSLYVYDAFVLDVDSSEENIVDNIKNIISWDGKFPLKIKKSHTLNNFKPL
jgi:hypothetical protein